MPLSGDIDRVLRLSASIKGLATVPARAAEDVSHGVYDAIQGEFRAGVDPYGTAWAPLAPATLAKGRHAPPLTATYAMRDSLMIRPSPGGKGIEGLIMHPARPHQDGWVGPQGSGPARPIFPDAGMPPAWDRIIWDACSRAIQDTLRRAA